MIKVTESDLMMYGSKAIENALIDGAILRCLVDIPFRGVGKTHQLVEFAKKYGFVVIVKKGLIAKSLREKYAYEKIFSQYEVDSLRGTPYTYVFDEYVDESKLFEAGLKYITGIR